MLNFICFKSKQEIRILIVRRRLKIYCEHSALTPELKKFQAQKFVELVHFPYDEDSATKKLSKKDVLPSRAQWRDMNLPWKDVKGTWNDLEGSDKYDEILRIIGPENRRDALHVDSAYKSGCKAIVTRDNDILSKASQISELIGLKVLHPDHDAKELHDLIISGNA